jgi:hypothetical protein
MQLDPPTWASPRTPSRMPRQVASSESQAALGSGDRSGLPRARALVDRGLRRQVRPLPVPPSLGLMPPGSLSAL